jgi:hypothetical protein
MSFKPFLAVAGVALLAPAATSAAINPSDFGPNVTNPWYPLKPGTVLRYRGVKDGKSTVDVVTVTRRTELIDGVSCRVVRDKLFETGRLAEETTDWFAQDRGGSVWYFGEATRELDRNGRTTSTEGSWRSGVQGAAPGVVMPAHPSVGAAFAQEHFPGHAEDHFKIVSLRASIKVPFGSFRRHAMLTREWTPLEPNVIDHKYYVRGIGMVEEVTAKGPRELGRLVSVSHR